MTTNNYNDPVWLSKTLELFKLRNGSSEASVQSETNKLLQEGLLSHLLQPSRDISVCTSYIVFFALYNTQVEEGEVILLTETIRRISNQVLQDSNNNNNNEIAPSNDNNNNKVNKCELYTCLVILQMSYACALQQTTELMNRDGSTGEVGNSLPQQSPSRLAGKANMSLQDAEGQQWDCLGVKGFCCLVLAIFRQPLVDMDESPPSEVEWFLHLAGCRYRAYTHIRLCMLPTLLALYDQDSEMGLFLLSVLCELMENLTKVFSMSCYRQHTPQHNDNDFPYIFFPPSQLFYQQNRSFSRDRLLSMTTTGPALASSHDKELEMEQEDSLQDVLHLLSSMLESRPEFSAVFWPSSNPSLNLSEEMYSDNNSDLVLHPFVMQTIQASVHHPSLCLPVIRFLTGLANPSGLFHLLRTLSRRDSHLYHFRISWDHFFDSIDKISKHLLASADTTSASTDLIASYQLTDKDVEGLVSIMKLISAVGKSASVAAQLLAIYKPLQRLFSLLSCPMPANLKGAIFKAIASLVKTKEVANFVWELLDSHKLLGNKGLRTELEFVEARSGLYPITDGFLALLETLLMNSSVPNNLGRNSRVPGIITYLDYIIDEVLLKAGEREYAHYSSAQKWRIYARVTHILSCVLQDYSVNLQTVSDEVSADFRPDEKIVIPEGQVSCIRPKSAGFYLIIQLLGRSGRLYEQLVNILEENTGNKIEVSFAEQFTYEVESTVDLLQKIHLLTQNSQFSKYNNNFNLLSDKDRSVSLLSQLSDLGIEDDDCVCDVLFWREKTVSAIIGIFYECSLRDNKFNEMFRKATQTSPITITRTEMGRSATVAAKSYDFSEILISSGGLPLIAHYVNFRSKLCPCIPSVNIMCINILEHVAVSIPSHRLIGAICYKHENNINLIEGCVNAIKDIRSNNINDDNSVIDTQCNAYQNFQLQEDGIFYYEILCKGGDRSPFTFSQSFEATISPPQRKFGNDGEVDRFMTNSFGSITEGVLNLLLQTLTPDSVCLSHHLLGLSESSSLSNCLDAIIEIMSPDYFGAGTTFIQQHPSIASDCYELIYRLSSCQVTSRVIAEKLRSKNIDFLRVHLTMLLYLLHLSDSELVNDTNCDLISIKISLHNCSAWMLKLCALDIHISSSRNSSMLLVKPSQVLILLLSSCRDLSFSSERGSDLIAMMKFLEYLYVNSAQAVINIPPVNSNNIRSLLEKSLTDSFVGKAGISRGANNKFLHLKSSTAVCTAHKSSDINAFLKLAKGQLDSNYISAHELQEGYNAAVVFNTSNKLLSSRNHLSQAWRQLLDICMLKKIDNDSYLLNSVKDVVATETSQVFRSILVPILDVMVTLNLQNTLGIKEQLARATVSVIKYIFDNNNSFEIAIYPEQYKTLLQTLVQLLIRRNSSIDEMMSISSSSIYRGFLTVAINSTIKFVTSISSSDKNSFDFSSTSNKILSYLPLLPSEEDKSQNSFDENGMSGLVESFQSFNVEILELCISDLIESLASDVCQGSLVWRLTALSTITMVLSTLRVQERSGLVKSNSHSQELNYRDVFGSRATIQAIQILNNKGYLNKIVSFIGPSAKEISILKMSNDSDDLIHNESMFTSVLSFCIQIASCVEGIESLMSCDILSRISSLPYFSNPPPSVEEVSSFGHEALAAQKESIKVLYCRLLPVFRLLRTIVINLSESNPAVTATVEFLRKNHAIVTELLLLKHFNSLEGMAITEAVTGLLVFILPIYEPIGKDSSFNRFLDSTMKNIGFLLKNLGSCPFPSKLLIFDSKMKRNSATAATWWSKIVPTNSSEESLQQVLFQGSPEEKIPGDWNMFDQTKLRYSLQIIHNCSILMRKYSSIEVSKRINQTYNSNNSNVEIDPFVSQYQFLNDLDGVINTFCKIGSLVESLQSESSNNNNEINSSIAWLTSSQAALPSQPKNMKRSNSTITTDNLISNLVCICENLICVVHDSIMFSNILRKQSVVIILPLNKSEVDKLLRITTDVFPSHSFIRQVARWIVDSIESNNN